MITGNRTSWQVRGGFGIKPGAFRFEERNRGISTFLPRLTPWLTRAPFGTMTGGSSAEFGHATAGPLPSAAEPDPPVARVPRGLGRGDGSTAQWGRAAAGILRGPVSRPRRPGGDRRGGLAGVRGCVVGGCAGRAPTVDPGCPRVGGRRRVAERRRRAGGGAHRRRGPARGGGDRAGQPAKQGPAEGEGCLRGQVRRLPGAWVRRGCGRRGHDPAGDLKADLLAMLGADPADPAVEASGALSAVSYRPVLRDGDGQLLAWPAALELGRPLPTVPLWLGADLAVRLDLEASHSAACVDLRIRQAG